MGFKVFTTILDIERLLSDILGVDQRTVWESPKVTIVVNIGMKRTLKGPNINLWVSSTGFMPGEYFSGHLTSLWRVPKIDVYFSGHLSLPTYQILSDFRGA